MIKPPGPGEHKISETWLKEWFEFGWSGPGGLLELLGKYAQFDAWCVEHEREDAVSP